MGKGPSLAYWSEEDAAAPDADERWSAFERKLDALLAGTTRWHYRAYYQGDLSREFTARSAAELLAELGMGRTSASIDVRTNFGGGGPSFHIADFRASRAGDVTPVD